MWCCKGYWQRGTGVNPAGDTSPNILVGETSTGISPPHYYYVLSDIADQYWLPSVRSASSRFHSAIRRHQFASVRQADSRLTMLAPQPWTRVHATAKMKPAPVHSHWIRIAMDQAVSRLRFPTLGPRQIHRPTEQTVLWTSLHSSGQRLYYLI